MEGSRTLCRIELLAGLPADELRRIEQCCRWRRHRAGDAILDRDSPSRDLLLVVEGRVQVVNYAASGREVVYAVIGAGEYFGELAAIDGEPRSAAVVALEDCLLAALAPEEVEILLRRHPEIAITLLRRLARIIRHSDERIVDLSTLGSLQRVWRELLRLARPDPARAGQWLVEPLPTPSLAARAGTARETVARALAQLAQEQVAQRRGRALLIADPARLERLLVGAAGAPATGGGEAPPRSARSPG
jgi:CRP/FNR family transcriptional regulator, cyclic AMP receptor protein